MQPAPLKIALVTHSLARGGAERSAALLSHILAGLGHEIHVVTVVDEIEYAYSGRLFNLGLLKNKDDSTLGRFNRLLALRTYLKKQRFDWVIDNRTRQSWWSEWLISRWLYPIHKSIYVVRSAHLEDYFPTRPLIAKHIYRKAPYIVAVSDGIKTLIEKTYQYHNVHRIYNAVDANFGQDLPISNSSQPYIIAYGRLDDAVKNYSLLLEAYAQSHLPQLGIGLKIMGEGPDAAMIKNKALALKLRDFELLARNPNPTEVVQKALFTALTSRYEGFPRVLIESLQWGVPVVSVDCLSGPSEIVTNQHNGLLVPNDDPKALADAFSALATNAQLYDICKRNAAASVAHLSESAIAQEWQKILNKA